MSHIENSKRLIQSSSSSSSKRQRQEFSGSMKPKRQLKFSLLQDELNKIKELFEKLCSDDGRVDLLLLCNNILHESSWVAIAPTRLNVCIFFLSMTIV